MVSKIWCFMIITGIVFTAFMGKLNFATDELLNGAKEAVELFLSVVGIMSMWSGIMNIAEKSGLVDLMSKKIMPLLKFLFPEIGAKSKAMNFISLNLVANFFGLGWAATPSGIMAVKEMSKLSRQKERATNAMCMFLIINMSSIQLIPISVISYRMKYGSVNPGEIVFPGIIATTVSTITAVVLCKIYERRRI